MINKTSHTKDDIHIDSFITNSLTEDIGEGDATSLACIPPQAKAKAQLIIKEDGIVAGIEVAEKIFKKVDNDIQIHVKKNDGATVKKGDIVFHVSGNSSSLLQAERLVLNCMQRMSGIATYTRQLVNKLQGLPTLVTDTRKTTPGFRLFEKWAVRIGGGTNHRFGLYDMIMIKDNHIDYAGGIKQAIERANDYLERHRLHLQIEIEARNLKEVKTILSIGKINRIMLDNFSIKDTKTAIHLINRKYKTESSGNITELNIRQYAECGVDYISVGALTHSVKSLDMGLKAVTEEQ